MGTFRNKSYLRDELTGATTPEDERILSLQHASDLGSNYAYGGYRRPVIANHVQLPPALVDVILPGLCATGRCLLRRAPDDEESAPLAWDAGEPWELRLELARERPGELVPDESAAGDSSLDDEPDDDDDGPSAGDGITRRGDVSPRLTHLGGRATAGDRRTRRRIHRRPQRRDERAGRESRRQRRRGIILRS